MTLELDLSAKQQESKLKPIIAEQNRARYRMKEMKANKRIQTIFRRAFLKKKVKC
jgi:hypothetical protein